MNKEPSWTVLYNIVSCENDRWVGMGWEFFDTESDTKECYNRQLKNGNCPCKWPYFRTSDYLKLGAVHEEAYNLGARVAQGSVAIIAQQAPAQNANHDYDLKKVGTSGVLEGPTK